MLWSAALYYSLLGIFLLQVDIWDPKHFYQILEAAGVIHHLIFLTILSTEV